MTPIWEYLLSEKLPQDPLEARRITFKRYLIQDGSLYKKAFSYPLFTCIDPCQGEHILREVHAEVGVDHLGSRSLAYKFLR